MAANKLHYLTVQDMLWINLQVTKKVNPYQYASLEESTYTQYSYGDSDELLDQAARFLSGFLKKAPFSAGNDATAFVGCIAFLALNGTTLAVDDAGALQLFQRAQSGSVKETLASVAKHHEGHDEMHTSLRSVVTEVLKTFPNAVSQIGGRPVPIVVDAVLH